GHPAPASRAPPPTDRARSRDRWAGAGRAATGFAGRAIGRLAAGAVGGGPVRQLLPGDLQRLAAAQPRAATRPSTARTAGPDRVHVRHPAPATRRPPSGGAGGAGEGAPVAGLRAAPRHGRDRRRDRVQRTAHADRAGTTERREAASAAANLGGGVPVGATPRPVAVHRRRAALARPTRPGRGRRPGSVAVAGGTSATGAAPPVAGSSPVSRSQRPARPRLRPRARTWPRSPSGSAPPSPEIGRAHV